MRPFEDGAPSAKGKNVVRGTDLTEAEFDRLTCLTYNVFSGPSSSSIPHLSLRTRSAIALLRRVATSADRGHAKVQVMALQEVSSILERALLRERWLQADWAITSLRDYFRCSTGGKSERASAKGEDDGVLLAVRRDLLQHGAGGATMMRLSGPQGKVLVALSLANGASELGYSYDEGVAKPCHACRCG